MIYGKLIKSGGDEEGEEFYEEGGEGMDEEPSGEGGWGQPGVVSVTQEEKEAIDRVISSTSDSLNIYS